MDTERWFLRYGELKRAVVGIIPKMLTQKVEYSLNDTGKELIPFISLMRTWVKNKCQQVETYND